MMVGTIQRWGNSQGIRLPKSLLEIACLKENDAVEIIADRDLITIRKNKHFATLDDLFAGYEGTYRPVEEDMGKPMGREVW